MVKVLIVSVILLAYWAFYSFFFFEEFSYCPGIGEDV
jgi:hypothetical protein